MRLASDEDLRAVAERMGKTLGKSDGARQETRAATVRAI